MYKYICLILLLNCTAFSNDCVITFGRNDEVVGVQAKNISMREEEIVITLRKDYYEVDVTFDFFNSGAAEKVQLGFPVESSGSFAAESEFDYVYDFKSYLNGKTIPLRTTKKDVIAAGNTNNTSTHVKWFIRDVTFPANSRTVTRVTYKAKYSLCGGSYLAGYIYGTGRFWKDGIGKMTVVVNHGDDVLIDRIVFGNITKDLEGREGTSSKFIWEANGKYKYIFENVNPKHANNSIFINIQTFEFGLYGEYSYQFGTFDRNMRGDHLENYHYDYSWAWSEYLLYKNITDIQHYTKNQIRLFINFFSALHGYDFKNQLYKEYFQKLKNFDFDGKYNTKYKVNPDFKESDFNEIEKKNVAYLLKLEKMIPKQGD